MSNAFEQFRNHVIQNSLVAGGDRVLLAVSGGKDSMAMLQMMQKLKDDVSFETGVFHLNHLTRGAESDADALFVEKTAHNMGLFCRIYTVDVNSLRPGGISFEEFARDTRYRLLAETSEQHGFNKIATAHNSDDNCETVLMRLLSGTGLRGLRGIPASRGKIIRPMLSCSAVEIYEYLEHNSFSWREDASNSEELYRRNFIRNRVFPVINERFPDAQSAINNLSRVSIEQVNLIDDTLEAAYPGYIRVMGDSVVISHPGLDGNLPAIRYIISRELAERYGVKVSSPVLHEITRNYTRKRSANTLYERDGITIRKRKVAGCIELVIGHRIDNPQKDLTWSYDIDIDADSEIYLSEAGIRLSVSESSYEEFCNSNTDTTSAFLAVKAPALRITARSRVAGDRIHLEFGTRKIKDLMIEKKLDSDMKNKVPIIEIEGRIAACLFSVIPGSLNRISCNFLVCNDSERIIRIRNKADRDI